MRFLRKTVPIAPSTRAAVILDWKNTSGSGAEQDEDGGQEPSAVDLLDAVKLLKADR